MAILKLGQAIVFGMRGHEEGCGASGLEESEVTKDGSMNFVETMHLKIPFAFWLAHPIQKGQAWFSGRVAA